jgi:amino-acid N-acetyltransferase
VEVVAKTKGMQIVKAEGYKENIVDLLISEKLPVTDLPESLENFWIALQNDMVIGVIGLEIYGQYGLLRSLAVLPPYRSKGVAGELLNNLESIAASQALKHIYLLTETAPDYFTTKGYKQLSREDVPAEVQQSSEFSYVCPQSAIVMKKSL